MNKVLEELPLPKQILYILFMASMIFLPLALVVLICICIYCLLSIGKEA